eukprot:XP_025005726.1 uncharacterized protein LOC107052060 [Gallus gallus]
MDYCLIRNPRGNYGKKRSNSPCSLYNTSWAQSVFQGIRSTQKGSFFSLNKVRKKDALQHQQTEKAWGSNTNLLCFKVLGWTTWAAARLCCGEGAVTAYTYAMELYISKETNPKRKKKWNFVGQSKRGRYPSENKERKASLCLTAEGCFCLYLQTVYPDEELKMCHRIFWLFLKHIFSCKCSHF